MTEPAKDKIVELIILLITTEQKDLTDEQIKEMLRYRDTMTEVFEFHASQTRTGLAATLARRRRRAELDLLPTDELNHMLEAIEQDIVRNYDKTERVRDVIGDMVYEEGAYPNRSIIQEILRSRKVPTA